MSLQRRISALVSKAYFPKELPPAFTTETFGGHVSDILDDWESGGVFKRKTSKKLKGGKAKRGAFQYELKHAEAELISTPKRGYERRNISITHPVPQALLSREIAINWKAIQKWLLKQTFSLDEIRIANHYERSIKGINFQLHQAKKGFIEATSDWLVKTDISRFYPTIYTHSIPWAAYGKERVKANLHLYEGSLADRLDTLIRACNRNQTVGIPIGPETSRILAEVISSRIDHDFCVQSPKIERQNVDRLQDDWFIGLSTLEEAETALAKITLVYREYGLEINGNKTSVERTIGVHGNHWISEIGAFLSHRPGPLRGARLRELFALSLRMQRAYLNEPVIGYILSVLESQAVNVSDVEPLESFLLKAVMISPASMNTISRIMINVQHESKRMSVERIEKRFDDLISINILNGRLYEAIWQLYTLRGLGAKISTKRICEQLGNVPSSTVALLLLDMESRGQCKGLLPKQEWANLINKENVRSDGTWLLGYESIRHGWLADVNKVSGDPFFRAMLSRDVVFYDEKRNVLPSGKVVRLRTRQRASNTRAVHRLLQEIRGFQFGRY